MKQLQLNQGFSTFIDVYFLMQTFALKNKHLVFYLNFFITVQNIYRLDNYESGWESIQS